MYVSERRAHRGSEGLAGSIEACSETSNGQWLLTTYGT